jgi:hypothetical protein
LFNKRNFPAATPALQFLLAGDRISYVAKMLNPNEPVQMIAPGEAVYIPMPVLVQTARDIIRDSGIQRSAVFVGDNVHSIVVVAHAAGVIRDVSLRST